MDGGQAWLIMAHWGTAGQDPAQDSKLRGLSGGKTDPVALIADRAPESVTAFWSQPEQPQRSQSRIGRAVAPATRMSYEDGWERRIVTLRSHIQRL